MNGATAIPNPPRRVIVHHDWGDTKDIMAVIMGVVDNDQLTEQVRAFAQQYKGENPTAQIEGLRRIWQTVRREVRYQEDKDGYQAIKHPGRLWAEKVGDCKSKTVFIYHVCRAIGVPCFIRFASYDPNRRIGHVYPVAVVNGEAVPVDAVWHLYNSEKEPTYFENHLPAAFAKDAEMLRAVRTSRPNSAAIGAIRGAWSNLKQWQKLAAVVIGGWLTYKLVS